MFSRSLNCCSSGTASRYWCQRNLRLPPQPLPSHTCSPSPAPSTHQCSRRICLWRAAQQWRQKWTWRACRLWGCWGHSSGNSPRSQRRPGDGNKVRGLRGSVVSLTCTAHVWCMLAVGNNSGFLQLLLSWWVWCVTEFSGAARKIHQDREILVLSKYSHGQLWNEKFTCV